jgi:hypothetical protein
LQLAKASAATLLQQEESDSADLQRGRVNTSSFLVIMARWPSRRYIFDEFDLLAIASLRALNY